MIARALGCWVALVACAAPWAFGALDASWAMTLAAACLVPVAVFALVEACVPSPAGGLPRASAWALFLLPIPALVGLVPLPPLVHALLVPGGAELLAIAAPQGTGWLPLSLDPQGTTMAAALALAYAGSAWVLMSAGASGGFRGLLLLLGTLAGTSLAVFGIYQDATQTSPPTLYWSFPIHEVATPYGPYVNRNHFAGAMEITAGITAGAALFAWTSGRRILAFFAGAALFAQLAALAGTQSRGGVIGAAVGGALLVWMAVSAPQAEGAGRRDRTRTLLIAAGAVVVLGVTLWLLGLLDPLLSRVDIAPRSMNRFLVQRDSLAAFGAQPIVGTGAGSFERVFPAYQRLNDVRSFANGHSDWTQLLMETGLVGAVVILAAVWSVVLAVRRTRGAAGAVRWQVLGPAAGLAAIVVHGFFDVNLHVPANALLAVLAASLASAASNECGRGAASRSPAPDPA